ASGVFLHSVERVARACRRWVRPAVAALPLLSSAACSSNDDAHAGGTAATGAGAFAGLSGNAGGGAGRGGTLSTGGAGAGGTAAASVGGAGAAGASGTAGESVGATGGAAAG